MGGRGGLLKGKQPKSKCLHMVVKSLRRSPEISRKKRNQICKVKAKSANGTKFKMKSALTDNI